MKIIILFALIILSFAFNVPSVYATELRSSGDDWEELSNLVDSLSVKELLDLWNNDSTTCLRKRSGMMAHKILDSLLTKRKTYDEIVALLGLPYKIRKTIDYDQDLQKDTDFILAIYYVDTPCKDGKPQYSAPLSGCFLRIRFVPGTVLVAKDYGIPCK